MAISLESRLISLDFGACGGHSAQLTDVCVARWSRSVGSHMDRLDHHPELRFADASGKPLPPLESRVAVKALPRFQHELRRAISSAKASAFVDALALLENADHKAVFRADPRAPADRAPAPFSAYLGLRASVLPPGLLLRGGSM